MNKERRKALAQVADELRNLESKIEELMNEEQDYYDNMPEGLQGSEKGEKSQAAIDAMESALSTVGEALCSIEEAQE